MTHERKQPRFRGRALRAIAPLAAVSALALGAPASASAGPCSGADADPVTTNIKVVKHATLCLLNQERKQRGLPGFKHNGRLSLASQRHANDMARRNYFAHGDFVGRIRAARYLSGVRSWTVGENIAWGSWHYATPRMIMRGWMNSPPHKRNILSSSFREVGVGVAAGAPARGQEHAATYATDFGTRR